MHILLVDDHALFRQSLAVALAGHPEIGHFDSLSPGEFLLEMLMAGAPDILLLDIGLGAGQEDGLQLAKRILQQYPQQKLALLSGYDLPVYRLEAKRLGARGFISKDIAPDALVDILRKIAAGGLCFPQENPPVEELTDAERRVLLLLSQGKKRREIAGELFLSERTVSNHLQHIFEKLQADSAVGALVRARQLGYIPPML